MVQRTFIRSILSNTFRPVNKPYDEACIFLNFMRQGCFKMLFTFAAKR